jgi:hypothetical protein
VSEGVGGYLMAGEKLLWKGRPQQGIRLYSQDVFLLPFGLFWAGTVAVIFGAGWSDFLTMPLPFSLFPLIFGLAGFYITLGRLIHDAWIRSNIEYALTDRRVIIHRIGIGSELKSLDLGRIDQINFKPRGDRGDIVFGRLESFFHFGPRSFRGGFAVWTPSLSDTPQFIGVENARRLFDQIEGLRAQARR